MNIPAAISKMAKMIPGMAKPGINATMPDKIRKIASSMKPILRVKVTMFSSLTF